MQTKEPTSAIALFNKFRLKFREVAWKPAGFKIHDHSAQFHFYPVTDAQYTYYNYPWVDLKELGLPFHLVYDPTVNEDPTSQMIKATWNMIITGPFADRKFYADPDPFATGRLFAAGTPTDIPIMFSHSGEPIPGLHFVKGMSSNWTFFVPKASPEATVIRAALELERAQRQQALRLVQEDKDPQFSSLIANLHSALEAVPA